MPLTTLSAVKVASTLGLGLVAGLSLASPLLLAPAVLALASGRRATPALAARLAAAHRTLALASLACAGGLLAAFSGAARHPYLLYAAALALASAATTEAGLGARLRALADDGERGDDDPPNGEHLAREVEGVRRVGLGASAAAVAAFAVSLVGNYGDA